MSSSVMECSMSLKIKKKQFHKKGNFNDNLKNLTIL